MLRCTVKIRGDPEVIHVGGRSVVVGHKVYIFGGYPWLATPVEDPEEQITVSVFNTVSLRWTTLPPVATTRGECPPEVPLARFSHTAVLIGDIAYMWGGLGMDEKLCNNMLYVFDVDTHRWLDAEVSGCVPEARWGHSACVLRKDMYVHGGMNQLDVCTNDIYKLDTTTMVWSLIDTRETLPPNSAFHTATIIGTKMFVFGGSGNLDDGIRVFDTEANLWLKTPSAQPLPEGRWGHSAFVHNGELYICFGVFPHIVAEPRPCNDMWKFSPETFSWKEVNPKVNDSFFISWDCCCMMGDRVIIFGDKPNDSLYILDFSPSLKTLCKLAVIRCGLEQSGLPHDIRWELAAMTDG